MRGAAKGTVSAYAWSRLGDVTADQAATQLPPAKDWLRPFAAWVTSGGAVHATVKPKAPIIFSDYSKKVQAGGLNPTQAVEPFNIRVTHEPPKGAAKKPE